MRPDVGFVTRWIAFSALGMSVGVFAAASLLGLALGQWEERPVLPADYALLLTLFVAGAAHGAAMGAVQSILLHRRIGIERTRWILTTAAVAGLTWALGGTINLVDGDPWDAAQRLRGIVLGGLVLGAILGTGQWLALRRRLPDSFAWIPANSLAWVAGTGLGVVALDLFPADPSPVQLALSATLGTLIPGAAVGAVTGLTLLALLRPQKLAA